MNNVNWSYLNTQPQICIYVSLSSSFPSHANIPIGFDNIRMYTVDILYVYIYIYRSRNSTGEENKQYNRRMLYWKLVRQRLGSQCGSMNLHCDFFIAISNENFLQFIYSCRYMVMRFSPPRATRASLSRSLLTRQVNFIRSLPPSTTL